MLLAPFSSHRFAIPFTFIIDPYFTAIIAIGLVVAVFKPQRRRPALITFLVLGCYVGFQGILHSHAVKVGEAYAKNNRLLEAKVHAFPQPLSPFYWKVVVSHGDDYHVASIDLWRTQSRKPSVPASGILGMWERIAADYQPVSTAKWVWRGQFGDSDAQRHLAREAWTQEIFAPFRGVSCTLPDQARRKWRLRIISRFALYRSFTRTTPGIRPVPRQPRGFLAART